MRAVSVLAISLTGVALLSVLWLRDDAVPVPVAVATATQTSPGMPPTPLVVQRSLVTGVAPSSMTCSVRGRIVEADVGDVPRDVVTGATITLQGTSRRTQSGADGRFVFDAVTAHDDASLVVAHAGAASVVRRVTLWPDAIVDVGDLVLHADAGVAGRVLDDEGRAVPRATVSTGHASTIADDDGAFELRGLAPGRHALLAEAPGHARGRAVRVQLGAGTTERGVELRIDLARALSGRVQTDHRVPIAGALVEARVEHDSADDGTSLRVESDAQGGFVLEPLPRGDVRVIVTHRDFLSFGRVHATDARGVVITLTPSRAVVGRVVEAGSGTAIPIARVQVLVSSETDAGPWRCLGEPFVPAGEEAAKGRFRVPLGIHTIARLVVLSDTHAPALSTPFWMGREDVHPLLLAAGTGTRLRGLLRDERGRPVPGAEVTVSTPIGEGELVQTGAAVALSVSRSDADGAFASTPLAAGRYRVQVRRVGYLPVDVVALVGTGTAATLCLTAARAGTIRGRVADLGDVRRRVRAEAVRVDAAFAQESGRAARRPSAMVRDGEFVFDALAPGLYRVLVLDLARGDELGIIASDVAVDSGREAWLEFTLPAGD